MILTETSMSCGVGVIENLYYTTPDKALQDVWRDMQGEYGGKYPFIMFSDTVKLQYHHNYSPYRSVGEGFGKVGKDPSNGAKLAALIRDNKLGTVIETRSRKNPNTDNKIKVWVWQINRRAFNRYAKVQGWKAPTEDDYDYVPRFW